MRIPAVLILASALAACAPTTSTTVSSTPAPVRAAAIPATRPAPPPASAGFRAAKIMSLPGVDGVIGADQAALQRQFGAPQLDVWEGDARKLQFSGDACVLDVYLYPPSPNAAPTATYVDARRASDGLDVDRAACIRALRGN